LLRLLLPLDNKIRTSFGNVSSQRLKQLFDE